jgi:hypothetical protein
MIASLEDYVGFLCKHNMSADQFLFCCLIHEGKFPLIYQLFNERGGFDKDELANLEERGYVINTNKANETYADMYEVTELFRNEIYGEKYSMWKEFTDTYPKYISIENRRLPAQSTDLDALQSVYLNKTKRSIKQHKKIMDILKYAVENDHINMGIDKWVRGEQWKAVESIMEEKSNEQYGEREL